MKSPIRLTIRQATDEDAEAIVAFEQKNKAYLDEFVPPRPDHFFDLDWQRCNLRSLGSAPDLRICLIWLRNGQLAGRINHSFKTEAGCLWSEIGYRVGKAHLGQGIATQALLLELAWLRAQGRFTGARAQAAADNPASVRVLTKAGFKPLAKSPVITNRGDTEVRLNHFGLRF